MSKCRQIIDTDGSAILPNLFPSAYLDTFVDALRALNAHRSRAGIRHALGLTPVALLARHPALVELACEVLGPAALPYRATLFDKSPKANWLVVWHQDTALPLRQRGELQGWGPWSVKEGVHFAHAPAAALRQVLALRVHLDDSRAVNGPLRVLPATHKLGVLSNDEIHDLAARITPLDCLVDRGGVLAMRPLLLHASSKSHSEAPRRVLHIEYASSPSIAEPLTLATA